MAWTKVLGGPLWFQWVRTAVFFLLFIEYTRLVVTADAASYRIAVMMVWGFLSVISLVSLVQEIRRNSGPRNT